MSEYGLCAKQKQKWKMKNKKRKQKVIHWGGSTQRKGVFGSWTENEFQTVFTISTNPLNIALHISDCCCVVNLKKSV